MMTRKILLIIVIVSFCIIFEDSEARSIDEDELHLIPNEPNDGYPGLQKIRQRRQSDGITTDVDTATTVLSILPLDQIGSIIGKIMSTGIKEMFNPDVGKRLINVLETQAPLLLTSMFTNLYSTLRVPVKPSSSSSSLVSVNTGSSSSSSSVSLNTNALQQLSNSSTSEIMNAIRRPAAK